MSITRRDQCDRPSRRSCIRPRTMPWAWTRNPALQIFEQVIVAVYTFLLGNLALLGVKKFAYSLLLLPLLVAVGVFRVRVGQLFGRPMHIISAHAAADLDRNDKARLLGSVGRGWGARKGGWG
jgi:hypothetical protein